MILQRYRDAEKENTGELAVLREAKLLFKRWTLGRKKWRVQLRKEAVFM